MTLALAAFAAGVILLQQQAALPPAAWALVLLPLAVATWMRRGPFLPVLLFATGFFWAALCAQQRLAHWLDPALEGRDLQITGVVAGLASHTERGVRFELDVESSSGGEGVPPRILLWWYASAPHEEPAAPLRAVYPGERWLLTVRLRRPHGQVNPNGFDYEAWLLERGIGATGYVRPRGEQRLLGARHSVLDRIQQAREAVRERFHATLGATPAAGILSALAIGDQRAIASEEWRLFIFMDRLSL